MVACYRHSGIREGTKRTKRKKPAFFNALLLTISMPRTGCHNLYGRTFLSGTEKCRVIKYTVYRLYALKDPT